MIKNEVKAWILSIGNEILIGRITNTNATWLSKRLTFLGVKVTRIITVPDEIDDIIEELRRGLNNADLIITTGGLGPTYDDKTIDAVAKAVNKKLVLNPIAYNMIKAKFEKSNLPMTKEREKMAYLPEGGIPLNNSAGTAPGLFLEINNKIVISLPGVPKEMEAIFEEEVINKINKILPPISVIECGFKLEGVPESSIAPILEQVDKKFSNLYIKSHPKGIEVSKPILEIKVLVSDKNKEEARKKAEGALQIVKEEAKKLNGKISEEYC
ncbi:molybdenum cofactor synthesis domain protein [Caldisphaera lagunensis DSM 15908]|uniref:Molybdenum cofactor synthesis domain protein n=1 Tax=Caldisphaera lagunensis (strain DSM 15908 / JCM 11604 / ANMR 0165 / IC-154) TaxID=1056495 RepID=L0A7N4_CALLD|nr:nicotinamide mononucleotide deamidase-related protein [Caldisphaera lagunensis]AFZ69831.1 molybdenum cofactor synthesis domain protein [Caldisphaera lagunensis DSM 15908]